MFHEFLKKVYGINILIYHCCLDNELLRQCFELSVRDRQDGSVQFVMKNSNYNGLKHKKQDIMKLQRDYRWSILNHSTHKMLGMQIFR